MQFKILYKDIQEIRMGSPYNICRIELNSGKNRWTPVIPLNNYQDLTAISDNNKLIALIRWSIKKGEPGFNIVILDFKNKKVYKKKRIEGCCKSIKWTANGFAVEIYKIISER